MLDSLKMIKLSHGRAHFTSGGVVWIQQGRPFGVLAVPGEAMLSLEDLAAIGAMVNEMYTSGWKPDPPGTIRPL